MPAKSTVVLPNVDVNVVGDPGFTVSTFHLRGNDGNYYDFGVAGANGSPVETWGQTDASADDPWRIAVLEGHTAVPDGTTPYVNVNVVLRCLVGNGNTALDPNSGLQQSFPFRYDQSAHRWGLNSNPSGFDWPYSLQPFPGYNFCRTGVGEILYYDTSVNGATPQVLYRFAGDPGRPPAQSPDPDRFLVDRKTCTATSGGAVTTLTATSAAFKESATNYPAFPDAGDCPAGTTLTVEKVVETSPGLPDKGIWTYTTAQTITDWRTQYPECASSACKLSLVKIGPAGTQLGRCQDSAGLCESWYDDPQKTDDYQCVYGPIGAQMHVLDLSECNVYRPTYNIKDQASGTRPYADPKTGDVTDIVTPAPVSGGGGTGACFPSGWGVFNPVEWVLDPIECAFVPSPQELQDDLSQTWDVVSAKPPISFVVSFAPVVQHFTTAAVGGCSDHLADFGSGLVIPCSPPGNPSWFQALYFLSEIFIAGSTAFGVWRIVETGLRK